MKTSDFEYDLPPERIAQEPLPRREDARMMVVRRGAAGVEHCRARDLPAILRRGDLLVVNDTRVVPCRLYGAKEETGGRVEVFFLEPVPGGDWSVLLRASRRPLPGSRIRLGSGRLSAVVTGRLPGGRATVRIEGDAPLEDVLEEEGHAPLPPYIRRDPDDRSREAADRARYQTVYARRPGAVAAPTAGLHLSVPLLEALAAAGVERTEITLHVGLGTFRPVKTDDPAEHRMEEERYEVSPAAAAAVARARDAGGRVVAVGTTTARTLETAWTPDRGVAAGAGRSRLFIRPPYRFRAVDALLTNFHLPRSTLLMMVCAMAGRERVLAAYAEAVREGYRFYSYGDGMLIL